MEEPQGGLADVIADLIDAVGDRDSLAHIGGNFVLSGEHALDVDVVCGAFINEHLASHGDGLLFAGGALSQPDGATGQHAGGYASIGAGSRRLGELLVGRRGSTTCSTNLGLDPVESRIVHVVRKRDDAGMRYAPAGPVDEALLGEDE